jgi:hypothetical protein
VKLEVPSAPNFFTFTPPPGVQEAHFVVKGLILEISPDALRFNKLFSDKFDFIVNKYEDKCCKDDLLIKANLIILKKYG